MVTFRGSVAGHMVFRQADADVPTPTSVTRWQLYRMDASGEANWDSVVCVDDVLDRTRGSGPMNTTSRCTWSSQTLTEEHMARAEMFTAGGKNKRG